MKIVVRGVAQHEGMQGFLAVGADRFKADAARPTLVTPFHRPDDVELADGAAALSAAGDLPEGVLKMVWNEDV